MVGLSFNLPRVLRNRAENGLTSRIWTVVWKDRDGLVRGRVQALPGKGKMVFLVVGEVGYTVHFLASVAESIISKQMLKFISVLNKESVIYYVEGEGFCAPRRYRWYISAGFKRLAL